MRACTFSIGSGQLHMYTDEVWLTSELLWIGLIIFKAFVMRSDHLQSFRDGVWSSSELPWWGLIVFRTSAIRSDSLQSCCDDFDNSCWDAMLSFECWDISLRCLLELCLLWHEQSGYWSPEHLREGYKLGPCPLQRRSRVLQLIEVLFGLFTRQLLLFLARS